MKTSRSIKTYTSDEQRLEQFKQKHGLKNDVDAVLFLLNEIAKCAIGE